MQKNLAFFDLASIDSDRFTHRRSWGYVLTSMALAVKSGMLPLNLSDIRLQFQL
jgi:hypothetical protein